MIILSVDLGRARTGLAICDPEEILASPICVIMERNQDRLLDSIANEAAARHAEQLVVGLPKNMDGTEGESAQNARRFAARLTEKTGLSCALQDERGTTLKMCIRDRPNTQRRSRLRLPGRGGGRHNQSSGNAQY